MDWDGQTPEYGGDRTGLYEAEFITTSCNGDCSAEGLLGPVSYCDVGDRSYEYIPVAHGSDDQLVFDLRRGRMGGWLDDDLTFSLQGVASEAGGDVAIEAVIEGAFEDVGTPGFEGELVYVASGSHDGNAIECTGIRSVAADWDDHGCDERPEVCPVGLPLCYQDICQAGVVGDPCDEDEHCGGGLMCGGDETCLVGATGDACSSHRDCVSGLCPDGTCSEGAAGDACSTDADCDADLLCGGGDVCRIGKPGDPCDAFWDCLSETCEQDGSCG